MDGKLLNPLESQSKLILEVSNDVKALLARIFIRKLEASRLIPRLKHFFLSNDKRFKVWGLFSTR
jgi:hypothetical protein